MEAQEAQGGRLWRRTRPGLTGRLLRKVTRKAPPEGREGSRMALWPLRVYTRKKRVGQRLNLTPALDQGLPVKTTEAPPGPRRGPRCLEDKVKENGLLKIAEKEEQSRLGGGGGSAGPSAQLQATGEDTRKENSMREATPNEMILPLSESVTDDFQVDSSSSNSDLVSGQSLLHDTPSSFLSSSVTDFYTEFRSNTEESISNFSSPEQFRRSDCLDWECPNSKEHRQCKNSTLLDISKAVAIENVTQFSNFSAIVGTFLENSQKSHRKILMTLADQDISPNSKCTSKPASDNAACEALLAEKTCLPTLQNTKQKKTNAVILDEKNRCLLTSTPSSKKVDFVVELSSVRKATFEELFPNVSNYVNSDEVTPLSSSQENSNEFPLDEPEMCYIIRASPGTRQIKNKDVIIKKKKYSPPKDVPQDIITQTNGGT
ncbi:meiosis-specific kinetochore protein isoform X1 [Dipodomys merriami]|uniref:meiosis-specific kinetochore protein isoform X1 n=1 Tax=Dipodomys merriami TaxID=94247 RepID=UPI0038558EF8